MKATGAERNKRASERTIERKNERRASKRDKRAQFWLLARRRETMRAPGRPGGTHEWRHIRRPREPASGRDWTRSLQVSRRRPARLSFSRLARSNRRAQPKRKPGGVGMLFARPRRAPFASCGSRVAAVRRLGAHSCLLEAVGRPVRRAYARRLPDCKRMNISQSTAAPPVKHSRPASRRARFISKNLYDCESSPRLQSVRPALV